MQIMLPSSTGSWLARTRPTSVCSACGSAWRPAGAQVLRVLRRRRRGRVLRLRAARVFLDPPRRGALRRGGHVLLSGRPHLVTLESDDLRAELRTGLWDRDAAHDAKADVHDRQLRMRDCLCLLQRSDGLLVEPRLVPDLVDQRLQKLPLLLRPELAHDLER